MIVTEISFTPYIYKMRRLVGDVNYPDGVNEGMELAVFVRTDEGVTGCSVGTGSAAQTLPALADLVIGSDPRSVRGCWNRMTAFAFKGGLYGPMAAGISAIDRALWDLRAKLHDVPLWKEFGGSGNPVRVYASGLDSPLSDEELYKFYAGLAARGVTAGKLKVGRNADDDERRIRVMIDALSSNGGRAQVIIDANDNVQSVRVFHRRGHDNPLYTAIEIRLQLLGCEEFARAFKHDITTEITPRHIARQSS